MSQIAKACVIITEQQKPQTPRMDRNNLTDTFTRLRTRLRSMAAGILHNETAAEDALQDAFCRMWARTDLNEEAVSDKVAVVAVKNICIDYLRRKSAGITLPIDDCNPAEINEANSQMADKTLWEGNEIDELTRHLMSKLNEAQRSVFEMVSNGIDYDIVAMRLGMPEATVRQHMCRTRKILRSEYKKWHGNGHA